MAGGWPEVVSHDDKVRRLFEEFDTRRSRSIELDAFTSGFRRFQIGFSSATVNDLFEKTDLNKDRVISLQEFQRFGEVYPTMVDCLYYRARDHYNDQAQKENMENARRNLDQLKEREARARMAREQSQLDTDASERKLQQAGQAVADAQASERASQASHDGARAETERLRQELQQLVGELTGSKDRERQRSGEVAEAQRAVETITRRVQAQDQEYMKSEERLREIERLLVEQQRELEKHRYGCDQIRAELAAAQGREQEAAAAEADAKRDTHMASDRVADGEARVVQQQDAERAAQQAVREAAAEVAARNAQRDADQRELAAAKEKERMRQHEEQAALAACDAQEQSLGQMEQDAADFAARRRQVDEEEQPLLEQEVRLREQRESLETKENKLRTDFQHFTGRAARPGSPAVSHHHTPRQSVPAARPEAAPAPPASYAYEPTSSSVPRYTTPAAARFDAPPPVPLPAPAHVPPAAAPAARQYERTTGVRATYEATMKSYERRSAYEPASAAAAAAMPQHQSAPAVAAPRYEAPHSASRLYQ